MATIEKHNPHAEDVKNYRVKTLAHNNVNIDEYPNFHKSGSIKGMKEMYYGKGALLVRYGNYIYNVTSNPHLYFEKSY